VWTQIIKQTKTKWGESFCKGLRLKIHASNAPHDIICQERKIQDNITDHTRNAPESKHAKEEGQSPAHALG